MFQFFLSSCRAGLRGRMFIGVLVCGIALIGVAYLSASFSPRQPSTVALDIGYSGLRLSLVLLAISLVQEHVSREMDRRTVILSFSYPVSRSAYVCGRYLGIVSLTALAAVLLAFLLLVVVLTTGGKYSSEFGMLLGVPFWCTVAGLWIDSCVVAAFALLIASLSTVASLPLILGLVFAFAGKSLGAVADYLRRGADGDEALVGQFSGLVERIFWILPDLSRLDWRQWPMYGLNPDPGSILLAILMAGAYVGVAITLSNFILSRRDLL